MTFNQLINIWTPNDLLNVVIWLCLLVLIMYLAKNPAHKTVRSLCLVIKEGLSHMANSILCVEKKVQERNREVLFTSGLESMERHIDKEFTRINKVVERDLGGFPVLKRQLQEQIEHIEDDYKKSSEIPPAPPEWIEAVKALSQLPDETRDDKAISHILKQMHKTTNDQYKTAMDEYKKAVSTHHSILNSMMPYWSKLTTALHDVAKLISAIRERAVTIDQHMANHEAILSKTNRAERKLHSSATIHFFISALFLTIAIFGVVVNFNLIALPITEMVGGNSYIGHLKTSDVVGLVVVLVEVSLGVYLMESMRLTNLFPAIGRMDDKMRVRMAWFAFAFLLMLACMVSSLAWLREQMILNQTLADTDVLKPTSTFVPTMWQMFMGFSLPFFLILTAFPLELFIRSSRTVLGTCTVISMRFLAFLLTLTGKIISNCGELIINLYDLVAFPLIWLEDILLTKLSTSAGKSHQTNETEATENKTEPEQSSDSEEPSSLKTSEVTA